MWLWTMAGFHSRMMRASRQTGRTEERLSRIPSVSTGIPACSKYVHIGARWHERDHPHVPAALLEPLGDAHQLRLRPTDR
jgi:hypothetical protein